MSFTSAGVGGGGERTLSTLLRGLKNGVFGTLAVLQKKEKPRKPWLVYLLTVIQFFQMLHFVSVAERLWPPPPLPTTPALSSRHTPPQHPFLQVTAFPAGFTWPGRTMQFAANVVSFASPSTYFGTLQSAPGSLKAFFYAALAWVFGFLLLFVWVVSCFITNSWPVLWVLPTLRTVSQLSSQVLFIPLLTMLLKGIACGNAAQPAGAADVFASCSSVEVQVLVPTGAIVAALFVLLCALFTLVYYDSNPLSLSVESRAHGRAELALLIARTLLVVIVDLFPALLSPWANLGVCAFAALVWLVPAVKLLPYYEATMNRINIAAATSFAWAVCCLALSLGRADVDVGVLLFMSLPLSVLAGLYLHDMQVMRIQRASVERLATPYEVEIKARLIIHAALFGHATDRLYSIVDKARGDVELGAGAGVAGVSQRLAASGVSQRLAASGAAQRLATPGAAAAAATAAAGASLQSGVGGAAASVAGLAATAVPRRAAMDVGPGGEEDDAALDWIASVRQCFPAEAQAQVIALYRAALLNFRSSAMLHVFFARFHQTLMGNRHLQLSHLLQAERMQRHIPKHSLLQPQPPRSSRESR